MLGLVYRLKCVVVVSSVTVVIKPWYKQTGPSSGKWADISLTDCGALRASHAVITEWFPPTEVKGPEREADHCDVTFERRICDSV
jgi:hypothetical protein